VRGAEASAHAFLQLTGTLVAAWLCGKVMARDDAPAATLAAAGTFHGQILPRCAAFAVMIRSEDRAITGGQPVQ
jgi:hypothetical protein